MGSIQCKSSTVGYMKAQAEDQPDCVVKSGDAESLKTDTRNVLRLKEPLITV